MSKRNPRSLRIVIRKTREICQSRVSALAVDSSVTVEVRWRVLPHQSLRLVGADREFSSSSFPLSEPMADDRQQGYSDVENALRSKIESSTPWKLQVRLEGSDLGLSL